MGRTLNRKALAERLDKDPAQITRWTERGMPHDVVAGHHQYDEVECREWIRLNAPKAKEGRRALVLPAAEPLQALVNPPAAPDGDASPGRRRIDKNHPLLEVLRSSTDPQKLAAAAVMLAGIQIADEAESGKMVAAGQLDSMKKALEEMRRGEESWMEIATRRGELIEREVALAVCGLMAKRLNDCLDRYVNKLATQVELWNQDPAFSLPAETAFRAREIRTWAEREALELRGLEVAEIDKLIEKERKGEEGTA